HRITQVSQPSERVQEPFVIPLVQADARLIEDVEHSHQARADLGSQPDSLGLAAGERGGASAESEVIETHVAKEPQPIDHFLEDRSRDVRIQTSPSISGGPRGAAQRDALEEFDGALNRQVNHVSDAGAVHQDREALGPEPFPLAGLTRLLGHELFERCPDAVAGGLAVAPLDVPKHAFPFALVLAPAASTVGLELELAWSPMKQSVPGGLAMLAPWCVQLELERLGQGRQHDLAQVAAGLTPGQNDALKDGDAGIAQHQIRVYFPTGAHAVAVGTGAKRRVEGELPRLQLGQRQPANGASEPFGEYDGLTA